MANSLLNIAKVEHGVPVLGVVYAPPSGAFGVTPARVPPKARSPPMKPSPEKNCWFAPARRWRHCRGKPQPSDSATDDYLKTVKVAKLVSAGSSLKFLPDRGRRSRSLSALWPHHGMGYGAGHAVLLAAAARC